MFRLEKPNWTRVSVLLGLWALAGTLLSVEIFFNLRVLDQPLAFTEVAWPQYLRAGVWVVLAPLVCWLARRVPIKSEAPLSGVSFHLVASVALMAAYYLARLCYVMISKQEPWAEFWSVAERKFYGRNLIDIAYYWLIVAAVYVYDLRLLVRQTELSAAQLSARLAEAELETLKSQLQPHFLFNAMNTIAVLVREQRNAEAVSLISKLSVLLRQSLEQTGAQEVSLRQELNLVENYVRIQQARFSDRLEWTSSVPVQALELRVPALLLQPLVENAILHGLAPKEGVGHVTLSARLQEHMLHLEVVDDGVGFVAGEQGRPKREGIGLSNTRERLLRLYGPSASMDVTGKPGEGTRVRIRIPFGK